MLMPMLSRFASDCRFWLRSNCQRARSAGPVLVNSTEPFPLNGNALVMPTVAAPDMLFAAHPCGFDGVTMVFCAASVAAELNRAITAKAIVAAIALRRAVCRVCMIRFRWFGWKVLAGLAWTASFLRFVSF